jgi:hypothetical protein
MVELTQSSKHDSGSVYDILDRPEAAFAADSVEEQQTSILRTRSPNYPVQDGVVVFRSESGRGVLDRAELWAELHDRIDLEDALQYRHDINRDCRRAQVPAVIAGLGKAPTAAFLAAHGFSNPEIAGALDVGSRTVSQYISDFKTGER